MVDELPPDIILPQSGFETESLTVLALFDGPRAGELCREEAQQLANEHVRYVVSLAQRGHILHAGALVDQGPAHPRLTGLGFSRLSQAELAPLIERDPAVIAGMESFRLVTHVFRKGGLAFSNAAMHEHPTSGS